MQPRYFFTDEIMLQFTQDVPEISSHIYSISGFCDKYNIQTVDVFIEKLGNVCSIYDADVNPLGIQPAYTQTSLRNIFIESDSDMCIIETDTGEVAGFIIVQKCIAIPQRVLVELICVKPNIKLTSNMPFSMYLLGIYLYTIKQNPHQFDQIGILEVAKNFLNKPAFCFYSKFGFTLNTKEYGFFNGHLTKTKLISKEQHNKCLSYGLIAMTVNLDKLTTKIIIDLIRGNRKMRKPELCSYSDKKLTHIYDTSYRNKVFKNDPSIRKPLTSQINKALEFLNETQFIPETKKKRFRKSLNTLNSPASASASASASSSSSEFSLDSEKDSKSSVSNSFTKKIQAGKSKPRTKKQRTYKKHRKISIK